MHPGGCFACADQTEIEDVIEFFTWFTVKLLNGENIIAKE